MYKWARPPNGVCRNSAVSKQCLRTRRRRQSRPPRYAVPGGIEMLLSSCAYFRLSARPSVIPPRNDGGNKSQKIEALFLTVVFTSWNVNSPAELQQNRRPRDPASASMIVIKVVELPSNNRYPRPFLFDVHVRNLAAYGNIETVVLSSVLSYMSRGIVSKKEKKTTTDRKYPNDVISSLINILCHSECSIN